MAHTMKTASWAPVPSPRSRQDAFDGGPMSAIPSMPRIQAPAVPCSQIPASRTAEGGGGVQLPDTFPQGLALEEERRAPDGTVASAREVTPPAPSQNMRRCKKWKRETTITRGRTSGKRMTPKGSLSSKHQN